MGAKCLTCKYESEWGEPTGKEYPRMTGRCQKPMPDIVLPICDTLTRSPITRHTDDSGVPTKCAAWEPKE